MRIIIVILLLLICSPVFAQTGATSPSFGQDKCIWFEEEDGSPKNVFCGKIKVTNGTFTNNGDGTFSLGTGSGGSSGSCWELDGSSDLEPVSGTCTDTLWEEDGNSDLQPQA